MIYHVYKGPEPHYLVPCDECGEIPYAPQHPQNAGTVCDMSSGPCSCGSWHTKEYTNRMNNELMLKVANPNFGSTLEEKLIINRLLKIGKDNAWLK